MQEYEYRVIPMTSDPNGYKYNVRVYTQAFYNGAFQKVYAGNGKFCKTLDEVKDFIKEWEEK